MEKATEWNWFLMFTPPSKELFQNHRASCNALRGTRNAITPKKSDNNALAAWLLEILETTG
jgi:hypothetical protein